MKLKTVNNEIKNELKEKQENEVDILEQLK